MQRARLIFIYFLVLFLAFSAVGHILNPEAYSPLIPPFFPEGLANVLAAIAEAAVAVALAWPKYRKLGGMGFFFLMLAFVPIHIWDLLKDEPFFGSKAGAGIRLAFQFALVYAGWVIWRKS